MNRLRALMGGQPPGDDGIGSEDDVYPLHFLDHSAACETIVNWTMRFNDVLDPDMLHTSLAQVFEQGDWRKLGGRLRKKGSRYQLHVPPSFTEERPALNFSKEMFDMPLEQHPLGCQVPRQTDQPSIQPEPEILLPLARPAGAPTTFHEYVRKGLPLISLHVAGFSDATLVTVAWVHIIMDAPGLKALLGAWTLSVRGKAAEIPDLEGARSDIVERVRDPVHDEGAEKSLLAEHGLSLFTSVLFVLHFLWDVLLGPKMVSRTVFLPNFAVDKLRRQAEDDLGSLVVEHNDGETYAGQGEVRGQVSTGDILISWIVRIVASAMPAPRSITAMSTLDARDRLPAPMRPPDGDSSVLVQNLALPAMTPLSASRAAAASLGEIALANRRSLMAQLTSAQIVALLRQMLRGKQLGSGGLNILGESDTMLVMFSNWTRNQFCRIVDFGPAVVRQGTPSAERRNPPGTVLNHYQSMENKTPLLRNVILVLGTDHEDNYWFNVFLDAKTLARMEESMKTLSKG